MSFLLPLGFFFAASLPALLIFYLLKVKRKPKRVSSTFLWRATVEDARASVPFQKLRRNLLMFLQLLALGLLTFALARPVVNLVSRENSSAIILVDQSASMGMRARPGGPTRLDEAKEAAGKFIAGLPNGSQVLLLPYAERAAVEIPFTTDRALLQRALAELEVKAAEEHLEDALALAASLTSSAPNPRIVIFSDTAELTPKLIADLGGTPAAAQNTGEPAPNAGWTALDLRRRSAAADVYDLFGKISVAGGEARQLVIEVKADGELLDTRRVEAAPGSEAGIVVEGLELIGEPVIEAAYLPQAGEADALELDNRVWTQLRPGKKLRLLLYGPGNYFLSRVLAAAGEIEVVEAPPGQNPPPGDYDLAIYDRAAPAERPPVPALYIGVSPWAGGSLAVDPSKELAPGAIMNWDSEHPVTSAVQWNTVAVFGAQPAEPPAGSRMLVEGEGAPLLVLGRAEAQVALFLAFDLFRSNLPLRAAFPIFLMNSLDFLSEGRTSRETESLRGGETLRIAPPAGVKRITVASPSGKGWELRPGPDGAATFSQMYEPGLWEVRYDGKLDQRIGVNLLNARESDPAVVPSTTLDASGAIAAGGIENELRTNQEIWRWFALAALGLLLAEWYFYQRSLDL